MLKIIHMTVNGKETELAVDERVSSGYTAQPLRTYTQKKDVK